MGTYEFSVADVSHDDFSADATTEGALAVGGSVVEGEIEKRHDVDWFAVTLVGGTRYRINLKGSPTDDGTLDDPYFRGIFETEGNRFDGTWNDDNTTPGEGRNSRAWFTPDTDGTYYLAAGAYREHIGTCMIDIDAL